MLDCSIKAVSQEKGKNRLQSIDETTADITYEPTDGI